MLTDGRTDGRTNGRKTGSLYRAKGRRDKNEYFYLNKNGLLLPSLEYLRMTNNDLSFMFVK